MNSSEEIKMIIKDYIKSDKTDSAAIMINGEWGSGKTYLIQNVLTQYIEDKLEKKCIYVTLNGISCKEDISKEIFLKSITLSDKNIPKCLQKIKSYGTEVGKIFFDKLSISDTSVDYYNLLDLANCVIIFDDLERCRVDIRELFGYINKFVEHEKVHTIIVANENEISERVLRNNQEIKYFLASQDVFDFEQTKEKEVDCDAQEKTKPKLTPNEVEKRIKYLFESEIAYYQIKEKLISKTIYYVPNIEEVFHEFVPRNKFEKQELDILDANKENTAKKFINENHNNLRTLQFIFNNFLTICKNLRTFDFQDGEKSIVLRSIYEYLLILSIRYKKGSKIKDWPQEVEYGQINLSGKKWSFDYILGFKFVNELVFNSYLDIERMNFTLNHYLQEQRRNGLTENDPLNFLPNWWCKEDEEVKELINQIIKKIKNNDYEVDVYPKIISNFVILKEIGFEINIDNLISNMIANIKNNDNIHLNKFEAFEFYIDEKYKEEYGHYLNQLNNEIGDRQVDIFKHNINNYISTKDGWGIAFNDYVYNHKNDFLNRKQFFKLIDVSNFVQAIRMSHNKDLINARRAISSVYNFSNLKEFYKDDYLNINEILSELKKMESIEGEKFGVIKRNNIKYLIYQFKEYKKNLS